MLRKFLAISLSTSILSGVVLAVTAFAQSGYFKQEQTFRSDRSASLTAPDGWLTLVGLEWLAPGTNTIGSAPDNKVHLPAGTPAHLGVIEQVGSGESAKLTLSAPAGGFPADLTLDGVKATPQTLTTTSVLKAGTVTVLILARGDKYGLRIKDVNAPSRTRFTGLHWYPVSPEYRVNARWIPYSSPHIVPIATVIGTTLHEPVAGYAEFTLDGKTMRLEPVTEGQHLFFIVRDTTSHTTTYGASRFLYTDLPASGLDKPGALVLDFNQLVNPPCAYTDFATCPLPPEGNRLQVAIPAGEKRYRAE